MMIPNSYENMHISACSECAYTAATKGMVQKHVQAVHRKEKPFECEICQTRLVQ